MKKVTAALLAFALAFSLSACGEPISSSSAGDGSSEDISTLSPFELYSGALQAIQNAASIEIHTITNFTSETGAQSATRVTDVQLSAILGESPDYHVVSTRTQNGTNTTRDVYFTGDYMYSDFGTFKGKVPLSLAQTLKYAYTAGTFIETFTEENITDITSVENDDTTRTVTIVVGAEQAKTLAVYNAVNAVSSGAAIEVESATITYVISPTGKPVKETATLTCTVATSGTPTNCTVTIETEYVGIDHLEAITFPDDLSSYEETTIVVK